MNGGDNDKSRWPAHPANLTEQAFEVSNVIAEIPGRDLPNEAVIIAGHLDSWHPGTGAQDNGTGVSTVIDVARAVKSRTLAQKLIETGAVRVNSERTIRTDHPVGAVL